MKPDDFISDRVGQVIRTETGYYAFIPHAPPVTFDCNPVAMELSAADVAVSELSGLSRFFPNPQLFINAYIGREAVASTQIDGTQAGLDELFEDELSGERTSVGDVIEIRNYVAALRHGMEALQTMPPMMRLIKDMHRILLQGVLGERKEPGEFRTSQNWIRGSGPANAYYVPPPPRQLPDLLGGWERFINDDRPIPDLIRCAIAHEYFETLHPFLDGNGRLGRLIIIMMLVARGRLHRPMLYVSNQIDKSRREYYERLQRARTHGERTEWVRYFLDTVTAAARDARTRADALIALQTTLRSNPDLRADARALELIDELFANPFVTVARAAARLEVAIPTATRIIKRLETAGILRESTGRAWGRTWVADPILDAIRRDD